MVRLLVPVQSALHLAGLIGPDTARKLSLEVLPGTSRNVKSMFGTQAVFRSTW